MRCGVCWLVRQAVLNFLLWADLTLNFALGGNPKETVSSRLGRAEAAGSKAAHAFCRLLNVINAKHCRWAMDPNGRSIGAEIWHWSPPQ